MVLYVIGVGTIATGGDRLDEVVVLVFLLDLVVADQHFSKNPGRIGTWLPFIEELDFIFLCLFPFQVGQEAQLVVGLVLIEVI